MLLIRIQVVAIWRFTVKNFQIVLFKFFIKEKEGGKNGIGSRTKVHLRVWMLPYISSFQILGLYGSGSGNAQGVKIR